MVNNMGKIKFVSSYEHSECGLACAVMMINYFKQNVSLTTLREEYGVPMGGFNVSQLVKILENNDVPSKALKVNQFEELVNIGEPFIAYLNEHHYVVVERITKKKVVIFDPAKGKDKISINEFNNKFFGVIICALIKEKRKKQKKILNEDIIKIIKANKSVIIWTIFISLIMQMMTLYIPIFIKDIIDHYNNIPNYAKLFFVLIAMLIFYFSFSVIKTRIIVLLQNNFDKMLTSKTVNQLLRLPLRFFVNRGKGEIIFTINSNQYIRAILSTQLISLFIDALFLILYLILMVFYSVELSIITLILGIFLVTISIINTKMIYRKNQTQISNITEVQNITGEIVNNISIIKAMGAEQELFLKWEKGFEKQLRMEMEKAKINASLGNIPSTIQTIYVLIIFILGLILDRNGGLTLGTIIAFNTLGASFLSPMLSIADSYLQLSAAKIYINQLLDIITSKPENDEQNQKRITVKSGDYFLNHISFKYDYFSENVLYDINLNIMDGEKIAIVGESGSGKTTLLMLLAGLYKPTEGQISIGDNIITDNIVNKSNYRKQLGIVLQQNKLFNGSIKENILMGREANEDEITEAIECADLEDFIEKFPSRIDTIISEDGSNLSGGQKQRLCIARAILKKPKVILMDEPTSSLDNISENRIMEHIFKMNSTVLVVAHRLSNIAKFDRIVVLNKGKIVSIGSHEDLITSSQYYKSLYEKDSEICLSKGLAD